MNKDTALRLALEALEELNETNSYWWQEVDEVTTKKIDPAITAIKAALKAKDEPEQMAKLGWQVIDCPICGGGARAFPKQEAKDEPDHSDELTIAYMSGLHRGKEVAQRTWVGLTTEEREQVQTESYGKVPHHVALIVAVEAKLKDKNT